MKPRAESLLHAMWMGPVGAVTLTSGVALCFVNPAGLAVWITLGLTGLGFVIAATAITAAEAFRQLQE